METHKLAIDRKQLIARFGQKSDLRGCLALFNNWICFSAIALLIVLAQRLTPLFFTLLYVPLSFFAACCLRGFDNLVHEASHKNIFKTVKLHTLLEFSYAFPVFKTVSDYAPDHIRHHKQHRHNLEHDPDAQQRIRWGIEFLQYPLRPFTIFWLYVFRLLLGYYVSDHIRYNIIPHLRSKASMLPRLLFWSIILGFVAYTGSWLPFVLVYVLPFLFWLPYIRFVTESTKHTNVHLDDDFGNSRNNIGWIHRYILHPHNDGYHQMHHFAAAIPFYNLRKAYEYCKQNDLFRSRVIESYSPLQTIKQSFNF